MQAKQVFHGTLEWTVPKNERPARSRSRRLIRPACIEPGIIGRVATVVVTGIEPAQRVTTGVRGSWLLWERLSDEEWGVEPGDQLAIFHGERVVARLKVSNVALT